MPFSDSMAMRSCPHCGLRRAQMGVIAKDLLLWTSRQQQRWYAMLSCPDCAGVTVLEHTGAQAPAYVLNTWPDDEEAALDVEHLPEDVARYYGDARRVLDAGVPDAAAVQLRRTLEAAAAHFEVRERVLMKSIERLINEGLVTKTFGDVLHTIRVIGNQGAHASDERVDAVTAQRALRFTTQLLRNLFEVPAELRIMSGDVAPDPESAADVPPVIL